MRPVSGCVRAVCRVQSHAGWGWAGASALPLDGRSRYRIAMAREPTATSTPRPPAGAPVSLAEVERWLHALYIAVDGTTLRDEERRKAQEVTALLGEVARAVSRHSRRRPLLLVDAAAGKSYVGLLAAKLVLEPAGRQASVLTLERHAGRVAASQTALARVQTSVPVECRVADVAEAAPWPASPTLVVALHACGPASDAVIERVIASRAKSLLLVPCCTGRDVVDAGHAARAAEHLGIARQSAVRRRFVQAWVDTRRTSRLEAHGYQTEVVEFVGATVTPHNLLWRAHYVGEPSRMAAAARDLARTSLKLD